MRFLTLGALGLSALLAACTSAAGYVPQKITKDDKAVHDRTLKLRLRNFEGSQFLTEPKLAVNPKGVRLMCGAINAPNGFGGYNGYQVYSIIYAPNIPNSVPIFSAGALSAIDCKGAGIPISTLP
ncbi:hypothetical protein [Epibacterium ulvae]|uniref:hypothetical protein n=1 Tax=Epibacterium ulvae TaxID=1156985 RepID=UPI002493B5B4|nr:hypothetical protein [Epibacterium ulvae]